MNRKSKVFIFLGSIIILVGCTNLGTNPVNPSQISTPLITTQSPAIRATRTSISTSTQLFTQTMTTTIMPKHEISTTAFIPSLTPLPTLSGIESEKVVNELLLNNAGCQYPCWWGIVPGKTTWPEANHFLASFVEITSFVAKNNSTGEPTYLIRYPLHGEREGGGFNINVKNNQIKIIFVGGDSTKQNSLLYQVLTNYGTPEKIYIRVIKDVPSDDLPLTLVLYYASKNFVVAYDLVAHAKNDELISCVNSESPGLWLWSPDEIVTEQRIQDWTLGVDPINPLKPLEQVTDLDTRRFTEIFSSSDDGSHCLSTNKNFWNVGP